MTIQKILLLASMLFMTACAGTIQSASISEAYKKYELQQFEQTLKLITRAENTRETSPEMKAELTYLKAQTYEALGQQKVADTLFEFLVKQHKESQYGFLASKKLNAQL